MAFYQYRVPGIVSQDLLFFHDPHVAFHERDKSLRFFTGFYSCLPFVELHFLFFTLFLSNIYPKKLGFL